MFTKLIILIIVLNLVGSFFKRWQANRRKEAMMRQGEYNQPPLQNTQQEEYAEPARAEEEPETEDVLKALFEKLGAPSTPAAPVHAAPPPPPAAPAIRAYAEPEPARGPEPDEKPVFSGEYDKIRQGKSIIDYKQEEKPVPKTMISPGNEGRPVFEVYQVPGMPIEGKTADLRRMFAKGSLRQAVIYHEVLGTPKGLL